MLPWLRRGPRGDAVTGLLWRCVRVYSHVVHRATFVGMERLRAQADPGPLIVVANHTGAVDPLLIQAEQKLIDQAEELVVLVDSTKFRQRSSLILCGLSRISMVITDDGIEDREAGMLEAAGVTLVVASLAGAPTAAAREGSSLQEQA